MTDPVFTPRMILNARAIRRAYPVTSAALRRARIAALVEQVIAPYMPEAPRDDVRRLALLLNAMLDRGEL